MTTPIQISMTDRTYTFILIMLLLVGCNENIQKDKNNSREVNHIENLKKTAIHDCTTASDTVFENNDHIKYVALKNGQYGVEIKLSGVTDTLDFDFNCNTVNGIIPKILLKSKDCMVLSQGSGFHYRNSIICNLDHKQNKINTSEYEIDIVEPSENDFNAFVLDNSLYLYNRSNEKLLVKKLPSDFSKIKTKNCQFYQNKITVYFENKDSLGYDLKEFLAGRFN